MPPQLGVVPGANGSYALRPSAPAALFEVFSDQGTVAAGAATTGQTWNLTQGASPGAGLTVISGKLTNSATAATVVAGYAQVTLADTVKRIGGDFSFGAGGTVGSAVLAVWVSPIVFGSAVPNSPCHLAITPLGWDYGTWTGGSITSRGAGSFATALAQDGTVYHAEVVLIGSTAFVFLPDGQVRTITNAAIASNAGPVACYEVYQNDASADTKAAFASVWADDSDYRTGQLGVEDLARIFARQQATLLPSGVYYAPGSNVGVTVPLSEGTVDGTNLVIPVTFPTSGRAAVTLTAAVSMSQAARMFWSLRTGSTTYGTTEIINQQFNGILSATIVLTGTPGVTVSYTWRHFATATGGVLLLEAAQGRPAAMVAIPLAA